jgi:hypothetical protein
MRTAVVITILSFCVSGCSRPDGSAFDGLLSSNRIDRIEIVDDEQGRTRVFTNDAAAGLLSRLGASNRITNPIRSKSYISGHIELRAQGQRVGYLSYFPREQVLSFSGYEFSLRDTNDISPLFR